MAEVTFLFTDIEGSTRRWEEAPAAMGAALARHDALVRAAIEGHAGHVFKSIGDGFCSVFDSASDALSAALAAQQALQAEPWGEPGPLRVRMAVHAGEAQQREGDYFGAALNRIARLLAAGHGGQVLISQAAVNELGRNLPEGAALRDLGTHRLRDLAREEAIYQLQHPDLPHVEAPLRSLQAFRHNLPVQLTSFIGREAEMAEVKGLLARTRLLTLAGSGGTGKTRLMLQVAADVVDAYENGVWLVELAPLSEPAIVPQVVAGVLGVREEPGQSLTETLLLHLQPKKALLLLDNCEHLLAAAAGIADTLVRGCPGLQIMSSSREGLNLAGELTYRVPSLDLPDPNRLPDPERLGRYGAVRLFCERAAFAQRTFVLGDDNARAIAHVCHRLDGIPLAIELAAARVKALPVEQIARRLDDRFRLLTGGSRTALPRQQTLRALIDWSYDLLNEQERALLRRLSVFGGGWTLEAAEAVCADAPGVRGQESGVSPDGAQLTPVSCLLSPDVLDLLTALVDKSLALYEEGAGEGRYRMLETVRQYALERLLESGEGPVVRDRHRDHFLALALQLSLELRGGNQAVCLDRLEAEHDNLRAALEWCRSDEEDAECLRRLAGALTWFWYLRGYASEGRSWLGLALERRETVSLEVRARTTYHAAVLAHGQADYDAAHALYEESLDLSRRLENRGQVAWTLGNLGSLALEQRDMDRARALCEEALEHFRAVGDEGGVAAGLRAVGEAALGQKDYETARQHLTESLALSRKVGDGIGIATALGGLADVARNQGNLAEARELFGQALSRSAKLGFKNHCAVHLDAIAGLKNAAGQAEQAGRLFGAAEVLREEVGTRILPVNQAEYEQDCTSTRAALGETGFTACWEEGRSMTLAEAISLALEEGPTPGPAQP